MVSFHIHKRFLSGHERPFNNSLHSCYTLFACCALSYGAQVWSMRCLVSVHITSAFCRSIIYPNDAHPAVVFATVAAGSLSRMVLLLLTMDWCDSGVWRFKQRSCISWNMDLSNQVEVWHAESSIDLKSSIMINDLMPWVRYAFGNILV